MTFVVSRRFSALTRATSQAPRQNVLDINADAVPAQSGRCVDRRDGQFEEAPDREIADRERRFSAWGATEQQLRDVAAIVHCRRQRWKGDELAGVLRDFGWIGEFGLAPNNRARVDQGYEEFRDLRRLTGDILNVDLGRVHARPGACGTAAVRLGLSAAHDLHAVHEELGLRRYGGGGEQFAERMRETVTCRARRIFGHFDLHDGLRKATYTPNLRQTRRNPVRDGSHTWNKKPRQAKVRRKQCNGSSGDDHSMIR